MIKMTIVGMFLLILGGCSKQDLNNNGLSDTPVFYINNKIGFVDTIFQAGISDYYMFTSNEPINTGLHKSTSTFANKNCSNSYTCPYSISFEWVENETAFVQDSLSNILFRPVDGPSGKKVNFSFDPMFSAHQIESISATGISSTLFDEIITKQASVYKMSYTAVKNGIIYNQVFSEDFMNDTSRIKVGIIITPNTNGKYTISAKSNIQASYNFQWNTGQTIQNFEVDTLLNSYSVTITDVQGDTASAAISNLPSNLSQTVEHPAFIYQASDLFTGIIIRYTDTFGQTWSSSNGDQSVDSFFRAYKNVPYTVETNEVGQSLRKISIEYKCKMYSTIGPIQTMDMTGAGVIAVALP